MADNKTLIRSGWENAGKDKLKRNEAAEVYSCHRTFKGENSFAKNPFPDRVLIPSKRLPHSFGIPASDSLMNNSNKAVVCMYNNAQNQ